MQQRGGNGYLQNQRLIGKERNSWGLFFKNTCQGWGDNPAVKSAWCTSLRTLCSHPQNPYKKLGEHCVLTSSPALQREGTGRSLRFASRLPGFRFSERGGRQRWSNCRHPPLVHGTHPLTHMHTLHPLKTCSCVCIFQLHPGL